MGIGLSLEAIKQQYNLPQNATIADVIKFANDNSIVIDFSGNNQNTAILNNPSGSILEDNKPQTTSQSAPQTSSSALQNKPSFNIDFMNPSASNTGSFLGSNNNSVFGFGNTNQNTDDGLWGFKPTLTQPAVQNITTSGQVKSPQNTAELKLNTPKFDFFKGVSASKVDNFLETSLTKADERIAKFGSRTIDPEREKIVKINFTPDGKIETTYEDGTTKIEEISETEAQARSKFSKKQRITSVEYVDGRVIETMANGSTRTRDAFFGERGYVKDGNSLDEELEATLGDEYKNAQTTEEKHAVMKKYVTEVFMKLPPEEREAKFKELLKNTDRSSESGQYLMSVTSQFKKKLKTDLQSQVVQSRESAQAQQEVVQTAVASALTEPAASSQDQRDNIDSAAELARDFGTQDHFVEQAAQNMHNINDDNAQHVTETAIDMNPALASKKYAEATSSATNTNQALLDAANGDEQLAAKIQQQLQSKVGDLQNAHISVVSDDQITVCNEQACRMIEMDLLDGDVKSALKRIGDLDIQTLSNGQAEGIHNAFGAKIKDGTIRASEAQDVATVMVSTETVVDDTDLQRTMVDRRNQTIKNADPEIRDAVLDEQGQNGHRYLKENQLYVDDEARAIDENGVYNRSVADNVQNYEDEEIQGKIGQRVYDSGDEEALNAMARHVYEYSDANRDNFINQLQNSGYDSVKETLKESKTNYENQKSNKPETTNSSNESTTATDSSTKTSTTSLTDVSARINKLITSNANTVEKAKQVRTLNSKEQKAAIQKLIQNATLPEIKGLALSGLKTEIIGYLLDNFTPENKSTLESIQYLMNNGEMERYQKLIQNYQAPQPAEHFQTQPQIKRNFFM
ncbi:hypothetical protein IJ818_01215 [bacterium]|nr:hypothetical protein [bacterium]